MQILILGASGATGRLLTKELIARGQAVKIIVRSAGSVPEDLRASSLLTIITASVSDLSDDEIAQHIAGCDAVASCLGHNLTFRGLFGPPRRLVTDATRRFCEAIRNSAPAHPVRFVLMNTTGNRNSDLDEPVSFAQHVVLALLRLLLPPHRDNEKAADYLRTAIGQGDEAIEWAAVRPDGLTDEAGVTAYDIHPSPTRSAIFDAGKTSRHNVAHFMAELICDNKLWQRWKGAMPVIYNRVTG